MNMTQRFNNLDKKFSARSKNFQQEFQHLEDPGNAFGVRFTAIPEVDEIALDRVFRFPTIAEEFKEPWPKVFIQEDGRGKRLLKDEQIFSSLRWWSIPNGGARQAPAIGDTKLSVHSYRELHRDGLIEMGFVSGLRDPDCGGNLCLLFDLPVVVFANLAIWADRIRNHVSASTTEYFIEMEICVKGSYVIVKNDYTPPIFAIRSGRVFQPGTVEFIRCPLGNFDEIPKGVASFYWRFRNLFDKCVGVEEVVFTIED